MGLFSRRRGGPQRTERAERADQLFVGDPRFDDWETVREFEDLGTARAWLQQLADAGIEAAITADHELDRFDHGDIFLQVPPGRWSDAEELLGGLTDL